MRKVESITRNEEGIFVVTSRIRPKASVENSHRGRRRWDFESAKDRN